MPGQRPAFGFNLSAAFLKGLMALLTVLAHHSISIQAHGSPEPAGLIQGLNLNFPPIFYKHSRIDKNYL